MIFTKSDASTSDEQIEKLPRELNIHYIACIGLLIHLLSTIAYLSFAVQELVKFLSYSGKVHFEGLLHLLRYIRDNNILGCKYYAVMKDLPLYGLLRQASIRTENQLMSFSDSSWQYCTYPDMSTLPYIIFYQCGPIDHVTHVIVTVSQ